MEKAEYIYHFVSRKDWKKYENQSFYNPPSLKEEGFIRMDKFTRLSLHYEKDKNIVIRQGDSPETYIQECLQKMTLDPEVNYFAFYISPFTRFEPDEQKKIVQDKSVKDLQKVRTWKSFYKEYIKLSYTFISNQEIEIAFST